ncbi:uncharacterized protein LOC135943477 [Cloeon dipterum]|uniref:uncharacterized protein LOC135943477 n=1 Tax=Cloeon dipterum TaxID=197152 RepID=UPI00322059E6
MKIIWMIILAHSVLIACASRSDNFHAPEKNKINNVKRYMKSIFNFLERTDNDEFLLILGDSDGESSELSLFLTGARNQTKPAKRYNQIHFPFFAVDKQTGVLVIDLPNFDVVFHNVYVDLVMAFTHKLIFEKAKSLQILLVMPDKGKKEIVRFWRLAMKLVAILDENLEDVSSSIALVGVSKPMRSRKKVLMMLEDVVKTLQKDTDFMKDTLSATYGSMSAEWIKHQIWWTQELMFIIMEEDLFAVFQRPGKNGTFWSEKIRKHLRELFFETDDYGIVYQDLKVIVDGRTKDYISNIDTSVFVNNGVLRRCTKKIGTVQLPGFHTNSNITQLKLSYANYVSKFRYTVDPKFKDYCLKVKLDASIWSKLKFELEKLDFLEKLKGENSTLREFGLDYFFVKKVQQYCKLSLNNERSNMNWSFD